MFDPNWKQNKTKSKDSVSEILFVTCTDKANFTTAWIFQCGFVGEGYDNSKTTQSTMPVVSQ